MRRTRQPIVRCPWRGLGRSVSGVVPAAVIAFGSYACEPPDEPPTTSGELPVQAVAYLEPARVSTFHLEAGVVYRAVRSGAAPWSVHLVEVDASRCELGFEVAHAESVEGRVQVSELARRSEPGVVVAINGDFFTPEDQPIGLEVSGGKMRGPASRPVFAWRLGELPWVGSVESRGDTLRVGGWMVAEAGRLKGVQVVSGFPALLDGGRVVGDLEIGERPGFSGERHPRTGVGFDLERRRLWLVVIEGRREGVAEGMTLHEFAGLFRSLGVEDAINLDGGGSSVMVIRGEVVSRSSDPAGERAVVNGLLLRKDEEYCARGT